MLRDACHILLYLKSLFMTWSGSVLGQDYNPDNQRAYAVELATGRRAVHSDLEQIKPDQLSNVDLCYSGRAQEAGSPCPS